MDEVEKLERVAHFVGLQVADQVPHRARDARGALPCGLLHLVLADYREPRVPRLLHDLGAVGLGDGHDLHLRRVTSGASAGRGDFSADLRQYLL